MTSSISFSINGLNHQIQNFDQPAVEHFLAAISQNIKKYSPEQGIKLLQSAVNSLEKPSFVLRAHLLAQKKLVLQLNSVIQKGSERHVYHGLMFAKGSVTVIATKDVSKSYLEWMEKVPKEDREAFIVPIYEMIPISKDYFLSCEKLCKADLLDHVSALQEWSDIENRTALASQVVRIVQFIHESGLFHKDVRVENFLVTEENKLLLTDPHMQRGPLWIAGISPEAAVCFYSKEKDSFHTNFEEGHLFIEQNYPKELMWNLGIIISMILIGGILNCIDFEQSEDERDLDRFKKFIGLTDDLIKRDLSATWENFESNQQQAYAPLWEVVEGCLHVKGQDRVWPSRFKPWTLEPAASLDLQTSLQSLTSSTEGLSLE